MSANEGSLGNGNTSIDVALPALSESDSWITTTGIDDPQIPGTGTPLPADATSAVEAPVSVVTDDRKPLIEEPVADDKALAAKAEVKTDADVAAAVIEPEDKDLSPVEQKVLAELPEAERPAARRKFRNHQYFMDRFLDLHKPIEEVRAHLKERSGIRYGQLESTVLKDVYSNPGPALANLYKQDPAQFAKLAVAVFQGDPNAFAGLVAARKDVTPKQIQEALDFHAQHKDKVFEDDASLPKTIDDDTYADLEHYFPELAPKLKTALSLVPQLQTENASLKTATEAAAKPADQSGEEQQRAAEAAAEKEEQQLWNMGRDAVSDFVYKHAMDPKKGAGVAVTPEERKNAPEVALLKDIKSDILFNGLEVEGKILIPSFHQGLTAWGKDREDFMKILTDTVQFANAREKENVLAQTEKVYPFAMTYYDDRLKDDIFKRMDDLIEMAVGKVTATPKQDPIVPAPVPAPNSGQGAQPTDWLITHALNNSV